MVIMNFFWVLKKRSSMCQWRDLVAAPPCLWRGADNGYFRKAVAACVGANGLLAAGEAIRQVVGPACVHASRWRLDQMAQLGVPPEAYRGKARATSEMICFPDPCGRCARWLVTNGDRGGALRDTDDWRGHACSERATVWV